MMMLGIGTMAMYTALYFVPWQRFRRAVPIADWSAAERNMMRMRLLAVLTLVFAMVTAVIGASGRYYGQGQNAGSYIE